MKVLVVADSHQQPHYIAHAWRRHPDSEAIIHCGDGVDQAAQLQLTEQFYGVAGNQDFHSQFDLLQIIQLDGVKLLITHGHRHNVKRDLTTLTYLAEAEAVDLVFFGHTHKATKARHHQIDFYNPGSIALPKHNDACSYIILTIEQQRYDCQFLNL